MALPPSFDILVPEKGYNLDNMLAFSSLELGYISSQKSCIVKIVAYLIYFSEFF